MSRVVTRVILVIFWFYADLAEQQTINNAALKPEVVLSPLLEWIIMLSTA